MKYKYIAIEGNIGAGKTTLALALSQHFGASVLLEEFETNPFLPDFYKDPAGNAFPLELSLLFDRYRLLQEKKSDEKLVSDFWFPKSLVFARTNLKGREWKLFMDIFQKLNEKVRQPELILYFHRPWKSVTESIKERGRPYEQEIPDKYLSRIEREFKRSLSLEARTPILWVAGKTFDPGRNMGHLQALSGHLEQTLGLGINFLKR